MKGKLTISRVRSSDGGYVSIEIVDETSGCNAIDVEVQVSDFAEALMGHGSMACDFKINTSGVIGKKRELRSIRVKRPPHHARDEQADEAGRKWIEKKAAAELVDGWRPHSPRDVFNSHRWTGKDEVTVGLIRFVEFEEVVP